MCCPSTGKWVWQGSSDYLQEEVPVYKQSLIKCESMSNSSYILSSMSRFLEEESILVSCEQIYFFYFIYKY